MTADKQWLQRERTGDASGWATPLAGAVVGLGALAILALLGIALVRLATAVPAPPAPRAPRPRSPVDAVEPPVGAGVA